MSSGRNVPVPGVVSAAALSSGGIINPPLSHAQFFSLSSTPVPLSMEEDQP